MQKFRVYQKAFWVLEIIDGWGRPTAIIQKNKRDALREKAALEKLELEYQQRISKQ